MHHRLLVIAVWLLLSACQQLPEVLPMAVATVLPSAETDPMLGRGDKADDPAIWVHPASPERSLILGTNKDAGLYVYDLNGEEQQRLLVGQINNVDLRGNLAVASNDEVNGLSWFDIDPTDRVVTHLGNSLLERLEPYGLCTGRIDGAFVVAVSYKDGAIEIYSVDTTPSIPSTKLRRTIQLGSQLEGCVFDDEHARLFVGEEAFGVWAVDLSRNNAQPVVVDSIADRNGLVADVEGLSLFVGNDGRGYLVVSAQEADRFVLYQRDPPFELAGIIAIGATDSIDAVSHTDGLDVSSAALPAFPGGLMVVQDDGNPRSGVNQNFKLIDWRRVQSVLQDSNRPTNVPHAD